MNGADGRYADLRRHPGSAGGVKNVCPLIYKFAVQSEGNAQRLLIIIIGHRFEFRAEIRPGPFRGAVKQQEFVSGLHGRKHAQQIQHILAEPGGVALGQSSFNRNSHLSTFIEYNRKDAEIHFSPQRIQIQSHHEEHEGNEGIQKNIYHRGHRGHGEKTAVSEFLRGTQKFTD